MKKTFFTLVVTSTICSLSSAFAMEEQDNQPKTTVSSRYTTEEDIHTNFSLKYVSKMINEIENPNLLHALLIRLNEEHQEWKKKDNMKTEEEPNALKAREDEILDKKLPDLEEAFWEKKREEFPHLWGGKQDNKLSMEALDAIDTCWINGSEELKALKLAIEELEVELDAMAPGYIPFLMYQTEQKYYCLKAENAPKLRYGEEDRNQNLKFSYFSFLLGGQEIRGGASLPSRSDFNRQ